MPQTSELLWYVVWIGVIGVGAMLVGVIAARVLRRRLRAKARTQAFTIQELREMRDAGRITQKEYEAMRATVIGQMGAHSPVPTSRSPDSRAARGPELEERPEDSAPDPAPDDER